MTVDMGMLHSIVNQGYCQQMFLHAYFYGEMNSL